MSNTKTLYATRDFKDAGTTRTFKAGEPITECTEGEMLNYQTAGLASDDAATKFMADGEPETEDAKANKPKAGTKAA